ncbi:hypothetical protein Misp02_60840 [Microtetraspora sp. NBRC 16547]|nr:hypothetical protein Misp02_60840 [Microtetraspora sp. NBRC 16547]
MSTCWDARRHRRRGERVLAALPDLRRIAVTLVPPDIRHEVSGIHDIIAVPVAVGHRFHDENEREDAYVSST